MAQDIASLRFDPVSDAHLSLLREWLSQDFVRDWWGDPEAEIDAIRKCRPDGDVEGFIVHVDGEPVAYVQDWAPQDFGEEPWQKDMPADTWAIDMFIGRSDRLNSGLGPMILQAFCAQLFREGAARVIVDPDCRNGRAISAYRKAGFVPFSEQLSERGCKVLLELRREAFERMQ